MPTDDGTPLMLPIEPTHGVLRHWISVLQEGQAALLAAAGHPPALGR
jgi:hypothetical protein